MMVITRKNVARKIYETYFKIKWEKTDDDVEFRYTYAVLSIFLQFLHKFISFCLCVVLCARCGMREWDVKLKMEKTQAIQYSRERKLIIN